MAENIIKLRPVRPCPVCRKPSSQQFHPFCSGRCQDIDLNRWLSDGYVIPGSALEEDDAPDSDSGDRDE